MNIKLKAFIAVGLMCASISAYSRNCRQSGNITYCDDGVSYRQSGSRLYGSDGTSLRRSGNMTYRSDGTSYRKNGSAIYGSDGTSYRRGGNNTYLRSDGISCKESGHAIDCY